MKNKEFDDIEFKLRQSLQTKHFKILNNLEHVLRWAKFEEFFFPKLFRIGTFWVGGKLLMSCGRIAAEFRKPLVPWATVRGELLRAGRRQFVVSRVLPGDSKERHRCSTHTHNQTPEAYTLRLNLHTSADWLWNCLFFTGYDSSTPGGGKRKLPLNRKYSINSEGN
jgi:hypothetical protein